jgi:hypothetical protein
LEKIGSFFSGSVSEAAIWTRQWFSPDKRKGSFLRQLLLRKK